MYTAGRRRQLSYEGRRPPRGAVVSIKAHPLALCGAYYLFSSGLVHVRVPPGGGALGVSSSVSGLLRDSTHVRQARSRCLRCCPRVAMIPLSRPLHRARGGHESLRSELAAPLGVWSSSQLARCAGGRADSRLSGGVAVLPCCCATRRSVISPAQRAEMRGDISGSNG